MTATAALLAVVTLAGQFGVFSPALEGELWGVRQQLLAPGDGYPTGVTYAGGVLFAADLDNATVVAYDAVGAVIPLPGADWALGESGDVSSPVFDMAPNQLTTATVEVDGSDTTAILVSDANANRVLAFSTAGAHLFTMLLDNPGTSPSLGLAINGMATGPGAKFILTTATDTLELVGSFAAAWAEGFGTDGAVRSRNRNQYDNIATCSV